MDEHKHRQRKDIDSDDIYILSGKLYCGVCGNLMTAETGTSVTGDIHRYYKCFGKRKRTTDCEKHNVRKDYIEDFVFSVTKEYVLTPEVIDKISDVVVNKFNSELADNYTINSLKKELREKEKAINSILQAIEQGIITKTTKERLLALEEEKEDIEAKIVYEECHTLKPLERDKIKKFLSIYANEEFKSKRDKNDFFNNFISRVTLYDNGIKIEYNTGAEREEITYDRPEENPVIYSENVAFSDEENKKLPFVFKRQSDGWGGRI